MRFTFLKIFHIEVSFIYNVGIPGGSEGAESACNAGELGSLPGSGRRIPGGGNDTPSSRHSCLENSTDRGARRGYSPRGRKASDTTERPTLASSLHLHGRFTSLG